MVDPTQSNPTSVGFESVASAHPKTDLSFEGTLPRWLKGRFVHTGPALFELERGSYRHWFDGLAMLAAVELSGGQAAYHSAFLASESFRKARRFGEPVIGEFATSPRERRLGKLTSALRRSAVTDNCNVNVALLGDRAIAMTESCRHIEFDPETLATVGEVSYEDEMKGVLSTPHPQLDRSRDRLHNLLVKFGRRSAYELYELALSGRMRRMVASLPVDRPSYIHSFAASERHLVVTESPLCVHPLAMRVGSRPVIERYDWRPERGTRLRVVRKADGAIVADVATRPLFAFHHVNAVDSDGAIDVDLVAYDDASIVAELRLKPLRSERPPRGTARLERLSIPLGKFGERIEPRALSEHSVELPRISPRAEGRPYRYVYAVGNDDRRTFFDHLVRVDVGDGTAVRFARDGWFPNEPLFVPAPDASEEGEGVVLCIVLDASAGVNRLVVLDAATLDVRAHAALPQRLPFHFHGQFFAESEAGLPARGVGMMAS